MTTCSRCGASNPTTNKFCGDCGAALAAAAAPPSFAPATELPPWLRDDAPSAAAPAASAVTPSPPAAEPQSELPAWLTDIGVEDEPQSGAAGAAAPEPLAQIQDAAPPRTAGSSAEELPEWLREIGGSDAEPAAASSPSDDLPEWLRGDVSGYRSETPTPASEPEELPEWLRSFEAQPEPAATLAPTEAPPWLQANDEPTVAASGPETAAPPTDELPEWLRNDAEPLPAASAPQSVPDDLPPWLTDFDAGESATSAARAAQPNGPSTTDASAAGVGLPVPDWSSELGEAPLAAAPAAAPQAELPAWLTDADDAGQPAPAAPMQSSTSDVPAWLVEESPTAAPAAVEAQLASVPETPSASDLDASFPAWLTGDLPTAEANASQSFSSPASALPSWALDEPRSAGAEPLPEPVADDPSATQALPAWLLDEPLQPEQPESGAVSVEAPGEPAAPLAGTEAVRGTPPEEELPAWLAATDAPAQTTEVHDAPAVDDAPAWLTAAPFPETQVAAPVSDEPERAQQPAASSSPVDETSDLPAWLTDASTEVPAAGRQTDLPPWLSDIPAQPVVAQTASGLPSWLDETAAATTPDDQASEHQPELLGGLDLPAWLRADSLAEPPAQPAHPAPAWLQPDEPAAEESAPPTAAVEAPTAPRIVRSPERLASMRMLEQLMSEPPAEPIPQPVVRRRSRAMTIVLALVALLMVGALLALLLSERLGLDFGAGATASPTALAAAQVLADLPANRPVLLAYEWDAQRLGELRPLEEVVVGQLAARKDVPLILVSTDPQGALLASERAAQLDALDDQYHLNGLGYANLGFKAGGPLALRRFAADTSFGALFAQDAAGVDLRANDVTMESMCGSATADGCRWANVSLLVIMADDIDDVRGWFEQVRSEHPGLQTLLLTSSEIGPQIQPYAAVPGVTALAGLRGAEAYARAIGASSERIGRQADATAVGGALFAAAVVIGGVPAWWTGRRRRRSATQMAEEHAWER